MEVYIKEKKDVVHDAKFPSFFFSDGYSIHKQNK
jgi:hypothetical protein